MTVTVDAALAYYASIGAALFPVPAGQKNPTGIVSSFVTDCSASPEQWARWRADHPNCNFGLVAGHSRLIIVDIDAADFGRDEAWTAYTKLCTDDWGSPTPPMPMVQSARGGWHVLFRVPDTVDSKTLRQPDARKGIINIRAGNGFVIAAGSTFEGKPYTLLNSDAPHPAPAALINHCMRRESGTVSKVGEYDPADVAALLTWMSSKEMFDSYEDWTAAGMALRTEFGDAGLDLWRLTFVDDGKDKNEASHWQSFATDPRAGMVTLHSLFDRAHKEGWTGTVRPSLASMFNLGSTKTVQELAAQVGANLSSELLGSAPGPDGQSMFGRDEKRSEIAAPILSEFMTTYATAPSRPSFSDYQLMPPECASVKLYATLNDIIPRLYAVCERPHYNKDLIVQVFAVVCLVSDKGGEAILRRAQRIEGFKIKDRAVRVAANALKTKVEAALHDDKIDFFRDRNLQIKKSFDNMCRLYEMLGIEVRFNEWLERIEVKGWEFGNAWKPFNDASEIDIRMHASTEAIEFTFSGEFHWSAVNRIARQNPIDPAKEYVAQCEAGWDGVPRLNGWLSRACTVPADDYHQMVGRSIVGGMVKRIREPGSKHDEMAVFAGYQGAGKSTLARAICPEIEWFTDSVRLGDEAKELVLSLAGRAVCEISEMGSRGQIEDVKAMLTKVSDLGRPAYARSPVDRLRRNIFIGTTNHVHFLNDDTGNRRFLPVILPTGIEVDLAWIEQNKRQLIGEAAALHTKGERFGVPKNLWSVAAEKQKEARSHSPEEILFEGWFAPGEGVSFVTRPDGARVEITNFITASDIEKLTVLSKFRSTKSRGQTMINLGFRSERVSMFGKQTRVWIRGSGLIKKESVQFVIVETQSGFPSVTTRTPLVIESSVPGKDGPPMPPTVPPLPMVPPRS